jgi:hypothetical protein
VDDADVNLAGPMVDLGQIKVATYLLAAYSNLGESSVLPRVSDEDSLVASQCDLGAAEDLEALDEPGEAGEDGLQELEELERVFEVLGQLSSNLHLDPKAQVDGYRNIGRLIAQERGLEPQPQLSYGPDGVQLPVPPAVNPVASQGNEDTCMAHAFMRVVCLQIQQRYGIDLDFKPAVDKLIESASECLHGGMTIGRAHEAFHALKTGFRCTDSTARYPVTVEVTAGLKSFDELVRAMESSKLPDGTYYTNIVTGTSSHAVAAHSLEPGDRILSGSNPEVILCYDSRSNSEGKETFRVNKRGDQGAAKFYCFHIIDAKIEQGNMMPSGTRSCPVERSEFKECFPSSVANKLLGRPRLPEEVLTAPRGN